MGKEELLRSRLVLGIQGPVGYVATRTVVSALLLAVVFIGGQAFFHGPIRFLLFLFLPGFIGAIPCRFALSKTGMSVRWLWWSTLVDWNDIGSVSLMVPKKGFFDWPASPKVIITRSNGKRLVVYGKESTLAILAERTSELSGVPVLRE